MKSITNEPRYAHSSNSGFWVATTVSPLISIQTPPVVVTPIAVLSGTVPNASALGRGGFQFSISQTDREPETQVTKV